ncbi:MAG: AAA family ATPase [Candidatus Eremiobacterota bacterium]
MKRKKIPYGISDFDRIRRQNYYYVDKTGFIGNIEDSPPYLFLIRPRRFGKSLFLSLMECYYDIKRKDNFEEIFSGTYIYDNPTEERNKYLILKFNFSAVKSDINKIESSFNSTIKLSCLEFIKKYVEVIEDDSEKMYKTIENMEDASEILKYVISFVRNKGKIYLLIDEYDNFTNTIISSQGKERYMAITHGEGFYRHFFNVIKWGTTGSDAPVSKLFITGVSPVTMDDLTSGFNIGYNITTAPSFNEMIGFTEEELMSLLIYCKEEGIIKESPENLIEIMRPWYNNYLFSEDREEKLYNSDMTLYFISEYITRNKIPRDMLDHNIKTDYKKLKYLIITDIEGRYRVNGNFDKLKKILEEGHIESDIVRSFPVDRIINPENFISLLYYFGLLTINGIHRGKPVLTIPNEVIRQLYYEYIRESYYDTNIFKIDLFRLGELFTKFAYDGSWEELFLYLSDEMNKQTALRDYIQGEKSVQTFLRAYLNISNYYITRSESELNKGYCDILMIPNLLSYSDLLYSYLLEIKYISVSEYSESRLNTKILEAEEELRRYEEDSDLKQITGETKLMKIILVFCGVELKYKAMTCE